WPRCPQCAGDGYTLCDQCADTYRGGLDTPVCESCAELNVRLAAHQQRHSNQLGFCLDDAVCDLVEAINTYGGATTSSCAGAPYVALGRPYVGFATLDDVQAVIGAALRRAQTTKHEDPMRVSRITGVTNT